MSSAWIISKCYTHTQCVCEGEGRSPGWGLFLKSHWLCSFCYFALFVFVTETWLEADKNASARHKGWRCKGPIISHADSLDVSHTSIPHPLPLSLPLKLWQHEQVCATFLKDIFFLELLEFIWKCSIIMNVSHWVWEGLRGAEADGNLQPSDPLSNYSS